jgi:hypothetical protein
MILGLASSLPRTLATGLKAHGISAAAASSVAHVPPVSVLFAAFLGYNPVENLVGTHALSSLSAANHAALTGRSFFPQLISAPFRTGLHEAFLFAIVACLIAAAASLMRGGKYEHPDGSTLGPFADAEPEYGAEAAGNGARSLAQITTAEEHHAR